MSSYEIVKSDKIHYVKKDFLRLLPFLGRGSIVERLVAGRWSFVSYIVRRKFPWNFYIFADVDRKGVSERDG